MFRQRPTRQQLLEKLIAKTLEDRGYRRIGQDYFAKEFKKGYCEIYKRDVTNNIFELHRWGYLRGRK